MREMVLTMGSLAAALVIGFGSGAPARQQVAASGRTVTGSAQAICAATPLQTAPFEGVRGLGGLRWIKAVPTSSGITGHLFYGHGARGAAAELHTHGLMPDGGTTKILWLIDHGTVGSALTIDGRNLTGPGRSHQTFPEAGGGTFPYSQYPSIVDVPTPGCWRFHVRSGSVTGEVTLRVVG